jgi:hemerythrin-like domain-containing protein
MDTPIKPDGRIAALGNQLIDIHLSLREELARLREDAEAWLDGRAERPRELRAHCLAFCSAVSRHHTGEDDGAFPALGALHPELRPMLEELGRDHHVLAGILRGLEELLGRPGPDTEPVDPQRVRTELDSLAALLESHFVYEEKRLVAALDALPDRAGTAGTLLGREAT